MRICAGEPLGTLFLPSTRKLSARKRWIGLTVRPAGTITVDAGAAKALHRGGKSLLAIGIVRVSGRFQRGDVVEVLDPSGGLVGRGLSNYGARDTGAVKGLRSTQFAAVLGDKPYDEIIHRDNFVVAAP
jgi:glutamate 5-kinase